MKQIFSYLIPYRARMAVGFSIKVAATIVELLIPWALSIMVDKVIPTENIGFVFAWGGVMILFALLALLGNIVANRMASLVARNTTERIRLQLFSKIDLKSQYDSVILACGASNPRDIQAEGRDAEGIYFAVDYLSRTTKSLLDSNLTDGNYISAKDKHVVVIGGGDTGNDCVGTAIRQGCASVTQLEMMPQPPLTRAANNPWPEWPRVCKTDYGQEEAIAVFGSDPRIYKTTVKEFVKDADGKLCGLICVKLESKKDEATGRMMMVPVEGSEFALEAELVLIAAGFLGCQSYVSDAFGVELTPRTNVKTAPDSYETSEPGVFTAGDMHRGQSLVVWAIREGREAARAVDESLMGYTNLE